VKATSRFALLMSIVTAGVLCVAPSAGAAVTGSQLTVPAEPTFSIFDDEVPSSQTQVVSGTTVGGVEGEKVDLRCYFTSTSSLLVDANVSLGAGGTISATINSPASQACRLRAVPAGEQPVNLAPYTGPVLAVGESEVRFTGGAVGAGIPQDFHFNDQQLTAGDDYDSISSCGLDDGYLHTEEFNFTVTYFCNDWYEAANKFGLPATSEFRVDGENAYFSASADEIEEEADGFPELEYSYSQDPANGNATVHDNETASFCGENGFYPPTAEHCEEFINSGVRDERTIEQSHDGHLVLITDELTSTDGKTHEVEALPENEQIFGYHGEKIEYKFPGEGGYQLGKKGEEVSFSATAPAATYIQVAGAADGDTANGRGAIISFQPSSPARFNRSGVASGFYFHNEVTVPSTGSATLKYAYAFAFNQAEVETLVKDATSQPSPPAPPAATPTSHPSGSSGSSGSTSSTNSTGSVRAGGTFRIGKIEHLLPAGRAKLKVRVNGAGHLQLTGKRVESVTQQVNGAGSVYLPVVPNAALRTLLSQRGVVHVVAKVEFAGTDGASRTMWKKLGIQAAG
jgi:hypothetical protein